MKLLRGAVLVAAVAALTGCDEDVGPLQAVWKGLEGEWGAKLEGLKKTLADVSAKVQAFEVPGGNAALAQKKAELDGLVKGASDGLSAAEKALNEASAAVAKALGEKKLAPLQGAIDKAKNDLPPAVAKLTESMDALVAQVSTAEGPFATAKTAMLRMQAEAQALASRFTELTKAKGQVDVSGINFKSGAADVDVEDADSKAQLDRLVGFMKSCPELTVTLTGHTSRDGDAKTNDKLSAQRAEALKAYLVAQGVGAKQVSKTSGMGSKKPAIGEPEPGSAEEKAMNPDELAMARAKNRRVTVDVIKPCP